MSQKNILSLEQEESLLSVLEARFENNMHRHQGIKWEKVQEKLKANPKKFGHLMKWREPKANRML